MIRFSYFGNSYVKSLSDSEVVSVALKKVRDLPKENFAEELIMPSKLFNAYKRDCSICFEDLITQYILQVLMQLDAFEIYKKYDGKVMCCFEKNNAECHRSAIMEWFKYHGLEVEEIE